MTETEDLTEAQPDRDYEPLAIEVGARTVVERLDKAFVGMSVSDEGGIEIPPEEACGEYDEDLVRERETEQLRGVLDGKPGEGLYVQTQRGGLGEIVHTDDDVVRIGFNHELAGKTLIFDVETLDAN